MEWRQKLGEMELEDAILNDKFVRYLERLKRISDLSLESGSIVYRYEDIIFSKRDWIIDLASKISVQVDASSVDRLIQKYDVFPDVEEPAKHVRQVKPGDYKRKLGRKAVDYLETRYPELFEAWGYSL